jgi:Bacterial Ig domain
MAMKIEFAKDCIIELHRSAHSPVWRIKILLRFQAPEGKSFSFAAVAPPMEAGISTLPSFANGFASGPAIMGGAKGKNFEASRPQRDHTCWKNFKRLVSVAAAFAGLSDAALAENGVTNAPTSGDISTPVVIARTEPATVRIIAMDETQARVRFTAAGLPPGLSFNPQTGMISGIIDREASRSNGAPFIVRLNVVNDAGAFGNSTIKLYIYNRPPLATDDSLDLSKSPIQLNVLVNDMDSDGDRLVLTDVAAMHGAVAFMADGLVAYAPNSDAAVYDVITYTVSDGHGGSATAKVQVIVK